MACNKNEARQKAKIQFEETQHAPKLDSNMSRMLELSNQKMLINYNYNAKDANGKSRKHASTVWKCKRDGNSKKRIKKKC